MPIVVNSNASATEASFNLSRANDALRKSLGRLSSGNRINSPSDDAGEWPLRTKWSPPSNRSCYPKLTERSILSAGPRRSSQDCR